MPATALLLSTLAVALPAPAAAPQTPVAYVGVARDASLEQAAQLSWGDASETPAIVVKSIYKLDDAAGRVSTRNYRAAVVQPGQYELSMMCSVSGSPVFLVFEAEFAAGKRYQLACEGRSARSVKVVSTEV